MGKKTYRIGDVKNIRSADVTAGLGASKRAVFGIDVAKSEVVVSIGGDDATSVALFKAKQPAELPQLFALATEVRAAGFQVEFAAESTGTYSDVLVYQAQLRNVPVFQVSTKFVHDAKEIHDGVPSKHDAKDASLILWLHVQGKSRPWLARPESQRRAKAVVARRALYVQEQVANAGRLEALLARHWPELLVLGGVIGVLLLKLLVQFSSPQRVAANPEEALRILRRHPSAEKRKAVVASAVASQGVVMIEEEEIQVRELAKRMLAQRREIETVDKELRELLARDPVAVFLAAVVGPTTAMVLVADLGNVSAYACARALEKACGFNLREHSSGKSKSGLHITKRGSPRVRQYLYLATLRLLKLDPIVRAWYASRVARGQPKMCAVIAVARKLVRSLLFVARGEAFDAKKLFDVRRLDLQQVIPAEVELTLAEALQLDETSDSDGPDAVPESVAPAAKNKPQASGHAPSAPKKDVARSPFNRAASGAGTPKKDTAQSPSNVAVSGAAVPPVQSVKHSDGAESVAPLNKKVQRAKSRATPRARTVPEGTERAPSAAP